jgi:hypothetical protein
VPSELLPVGARRGRHCPAGAGQRRRTGDARTAGRAPGASRAGPGQDPLRARRRPDEARGLGRGGRRPGGPRAGRLADCRSGFQCVQSLHGVPSPGPICVAGTTTSIPLGQLCQSDTDCTAGTQLCVLFDATPEATGAPTNGQCTQLCQPSMSNSCGPGAVCSPFGQCLPTCSTDADCPAGTGMLAITCSSRLGGGPLPEPACVPSRPGARAGDPCSSFADCAVGATCQLDIPQQLPQSYPGDYCDPTAASTCGPGGACVGNDAVNTHSGVCYSSCTRMATAGTVTLA